MRSPGRRGGSAWWLLAAAVLWQACGAPVEAEVAPVEDSAPAVSVTSRALETEDLLQQLQAVPGVVSVNEAPSTVPGTRFFRMLFEVPTDHHRPNGERFSLRVTLLHRSATAPMVLYSGGYSVSSFSFEYEPTWLLEANQLSVEYRYFGGSFPASRDWTRLDARQAAGDFHRIVQAFRPLYPARWLNTGGSKGGMAAVHHRFFYPHDVDATIAYVAPTPHGLSDPRFIQHLEQVGDAACRERLKGLQRTALERREEMLPLMEDLAASWGDSFDILGTDRAFEFTVLEFPFYFWQYGQATWCGFLPDPATVSTAELFSVLDGVSDILYTFGDAALDFYAGYYYQSATELGGPGYPDAHLRDLLRYRGKDLPAAYLPFQVTEPFNPLVPLLAELWVHHAGQRIMFLYGDRDPWSAAPFSVRERNDSWRFTVPDANHNNTRISRLPDAERALAAWRLSVWMDAPVRPLPTQQPLTAFGPTLDAPHNEPVDGRRRP
ncbi:S28 family serine protease [Pyxidicoccus sp. 3LG]